MQTQNYLDKNSTSGYIGFDPTADSLHIGNLVQIMTLVHFQKCGHTPIILIGGATGMIGDPSGKDSTRKILEPNEIKKNTRRYAKRQITWFKKQENTTWFDYKEPYKNVLLHVKNKF